MLLQCKADGEEEEPLIFVGTIVVAVNAEQKRWRFVYL